MFASHTFFEGFEFRIYTEHLNFNNHKIMKWRNYSNKHCIKMTCG